MKDELPDLTPYLNKKGGNSQGRGDEPAGKTDISQKLSALVKKPGTSTGSHSTILPSVPAAAPAPHPTHDPSPVEPPRQEDEESSIGIVKPRAPVDEVSESSIGIVQKAADNGTIDGRSPSGSNGRGQQSASRWGDLSNFGETSHLDNTLVRNASQAEKAIIIDAAARVDDGDAPPTVLHSDESYAPSVNRETGRAVIGQPLDKLKSPQAKPISTLSSSSAPPLLKTPSKQPGRPAQPYSYKPAVEPGREAMAPRAPIAAPVNRAPQPIATPRPQMSDTKISAAPAKAPTAPTSPSSSSSSLTPPSPSLYSSPAVSPPRPQPQRAETEAEKLARAFMEEALALQEESRQDAPTTEYFDDYLSDPIPDSQLGSQSDFLSEPQSNDYGETYSYNQSPSLEDDLGQSPVVHSPPVAKLSEPPDFYASQAMAQVGESVPHEPGPRASLSNLFDSGVYSSRQEDETPKKPVGFGNLLGGAQAPDDDNKHSTFADLMVPTGEHDALFAPDRREPSATSAFDEIAAQINAEENAVQRSLSGDSLSPSSFEQASYQADEGSQAPAFSSLFSSEIVTSGNDFSSRFARPDNSAQSLQSDISEAPDMQAEEESHSLKSKSIAINKLIEAVNQSESSENKDGEFSSGTAGGIDQDFSFADSTGDGAGLFSSEIVGAVIASDPTADLEQGQSLPFSASVSTPASQSGTPASIPTPDPASLSPTALEALAAFVPNAGEEQHETKGLLAKLKAKDAAVNAAQKAAAAKATENAANGYKSQDIVKTEKVSEQSAAEKATPPVVSEPGENKPIASLASLLAQTQSEAEEIKEAPAAAVGAAAPRAPEPKAAVKSSAEEDEDSGNSLGDAISDALDKLLGEKSDSVDVSSAPVNEPSSLASPDYDKRDFLKENDIATAPAASPVTGGRTPLLDDDPDRFNRPINSNLRETEDVLPSVVAASASFNVPDEQPPASSTFQPPVADDHALTLTNSKVDALSRLLEVASKAPEKSSDEKKKAAESSHKLTEMVNKAPGKISRQNETLDAPDYMQQQNSPGKESFTSPFGGGTSPFSSPGNSYTGPAAKPLQTGSPFGTPVNSTNSGVSLNHTPAGGFSATGQSQPLAGGFSGTGSMSDMPKASGIGGDAVSARIAALNRKLEEQTKGPGTSATVGALSPTGSFQMPTPELPPQLQPAVDVVANPLVDDSPQTRAELVNRIIGSAKITQPSAAPSPTRSMQELPVDQALAQIRSQKEVKAPKSPPKSKARSRAPSPGFDPRTLLLVVAVICIAGLGAVLAVQNGIFKNFDLSKMTAPDFGKNKAGDSKITVEQLIKSGDLDKAREILEAKKESGKFSSSDGDKLYSIYYQLADKAISNGDDPAEATKLLEKIPSKTKKFKDAQKLLRKLKKKAKKN